MSGGARIGDPTPPLQLLCAGAVQGLVRALARRFEADAGAAIGGRFGAVGAMKDALLGGAACDVLVVTATMLRDLAEAGAIVPGSMRPVGLVRTGVAARSGEPAPHVDSATALKDAWLGATALHVPDLVKSTAGAHVASVLDRLGIRTAMEDRLTVFPNGATAMQALAGHGAVGALGCTQVTEILYTPGLALAGALPDPFGLATVYSAGVARGAADPALAARFVELLCGNASAPERRAGGFEPLPSSS